jgi:quinol monooxygenase YgiN
MKGDSMIKVIARNHLKAGSRDVALKLMDELIEKTRGESGCLGYELYQAGSDPDEVTFIETWESREALEAHMRSEHFTRIVPGLAAYQTGDTDIETYTLLK